MFSAGIEFHETFGCTVVCAACRTKILHIFHGKARLCFEIDTFRDPSAKTLGVESEVLEMAAGKCVVSPPWFPVHKKCIFPSMRSKAIHTVLIWCFALVPGKHDKRCFGKNRK